MYHCVYRITHLLDWKSYIGKHSGAILSVDDIGKPGGYFSSSHDNNFMVDQKENPQNYKYKILMTFETSTAATDYEIYLHAKYDVKLNPWFYNLANQTSSGFDTTGRRGNEREKERKRKIQPTLKIENPSRYKEINAKRGKSLTGLKNPNARPILQINLITGKLIKKWNFIKEAADALKISPSAISHAANPNHGNKSAGGFGWKNTLKKPTVKRKKYKKTNKNKAENHPASKPIIQLDLITRKPIKEWSCASEASKQLNIEVTTIRRVTNVNTNNKSAGGFGWILKEIQ